MNRTTTNLTGATHSLYIPDPLCVIFLSVGVWVYVRFVYALFSVLPLLDGTRVHTESTRPAPGRRANVCPAHCRGTIYRQGISASIRSLAYMGFWGQIHPLFPAR